MKRVLTLAALLGLLALNFSDALAGIGQNIGGGISQFDNGISYGGLGGFVPPSGCASTGIFDLSNTCNDIYLLTGSL